MNRKSMRWKIRELRRKVRKALGRRNTFGDRIIIEDEVLVYQGNKLLFKSKGHIVNQGLIHLINHMSAETFVITPSKGWDGMVGYGIIHVGTGVGVTTGNMTSLAADEGTDPDSQSGATSTPAGGSYRVSWTAVWNAGSLAAINVSELGLRLYLDGLALNAFGGSGVGGTKQFCSRLSDADGDFTTFLVDTGNPLTIEWRLTFSFA